MGLTIFFAQFFGLWFIIAGAALLYKKEVVVKAWEETGKNGISMIIGLALVINNNYWMWDWPVIITLIGWVNLVKALLHLFKPQLLSSYSKTLFDGQRAYATGIIGLLIGIYLTYQGFFVM